MSSVDYRVQLFAPLANGTFGMSGNPDLEFLRPKNLGWSDYLNGVPEAFFTIDQDDEQLMKLSTSAPGTWHTRILRNREIVWSGIFGTEVDANERDVIFYNHGYLAYLAGLCTDWHVTYANSSVGTIISDAWTRAKTGLTSSPVNFVTTGTIETPLTTVGGATLLLPTYDAYYKPILNLLQELTVLVASDQSVIVRFEITHSATPTFNYWYNYGAVGSASQWLPMPYWRLGDGRVAGFSDYTMPIQRRNELLAVGSSPTSDLLRFDSANASSYTTMGRRQSPLYLSWVRDQTELQRVANFRRWQAEFNSRDIQLRMHPNKVLPPGATGAEFRVGSLADVQIQRGASWFGPDPYLIQGVRVIWVKGQEYVRPILQTYPSNG